MIMVLYCIDEFGKDAGQYCMIMVLYCIDEFGKDTGQYCMIDYGSVL